MGLSDRDGAEASAVQDCKLEFSSGDVICVSRKSRRPDFAARSLFPMAARDFQHALGVEAFGEGGIVCAASRLGIDRPLIRRDRKRQGQENARAGASSL